MQSDNSSWNRDRLTFKKHLMRHVERFLKPEEPESAILHKAMEKAFHDVANDSEDLRLKFLNQTLWHLYTPPNLWINGRTRAGNKVPGEVLVAAYTMWRKAIYFAANRGIDSITASSAMLRAVNITTDKLAKGCCINNIVKYLFKSYRNNIVRLDSAYDRVRITEEHLSDLGGSSSGIEKVLLCSEMLDLMPPRGRQVAIARYYFDDDWPEIAEELNITINAAQKALSEAIRKAHEAYVKRSKTIEKKRHGKKRRWSYPGA